MSRVFDSKNYTRPPFPVMMRGQTWAVSFESCTARQNIINGLALVVLAHLCMLSALGCQDLFFSPEKPPLASTKSVTCRVDKL